MGNSAISKIQTGSPAYVNTFTDGDLTAGVLTVTHNLNAQYVSVTVYNNNDLIIIPDDVDATGVNACDIDLTSFGTLTGTWRVVIIDTGGTWNGTASGLALPGQTSGDRLVFDGSSWVRNPLVGFRAYTSVNQAIPNTGPTKVVIDTEQWDIGGYFDSTTNYRYTPLVAGKYVVFAKILLQDLADGFYCDLTVNKNGLTVMRNRKTGNPTASTDVLISTQDIVDMNGTTDYLEMFVDHNDTTTPRNLRGTFTYSTYFGAYLLA
jgi:hypothetical protein